MSKERVMVGMSGGVDSSVAAALLLKQGYNVTGATLSLYRENKDGGSCGQANDINDAKKVCDKLGIEHLVYDFCDDFKNLVVDEFINQYNSGLTPNPCIECNKNIKFSKMLDAALEAGCDYIATGHYSAIKYDDSSKRWLMYRPCDNSKDQTYVLYTLNQHQLKHTLMPLSCLTKKEVRETAEELGLINAEKPDSQDICFVPDGDYAGFIERYSGFASKKGDFVDKNGKILGQHNGIIRYTIGQRKGLGIALGKPAFVIDKNIETNKIILSDEENLFFKRVLVNKLNFIPFDSLKKELSVKAKLRYRHTEQPAVLHPLENGQLIVEFDKPQRAPSPGQAAVFYDGDIVIGGGVIVKGVD